MGMPAFIIKLQRGDQEWYLMWSTVCDAPLCEGMSKEKFVEWYGWRYGEQAAAEVLPALLPIVERRGVSTFWYANVEEAVRYNRAGEGESDLTMDQLIDKYCVWGSTRVQRLLDQGVKNAQELDKQLKLVIKRT